MQLIDPATLYSHGADDDDEVAPWIQGLIGVNDDTADDWYC